MSICDETCRDCAFRSRLNFYGIVCNYLMVTGRRRGCPAGEGCLRKVPGAKRISMDARIFRIPPNPARNLSDPAKTAEQLRAETEAEKRRKVERLAEKKRRKAEQHRAWAARNREHLREYRRERRNRMKDRG